MRGGKKKIQLQLHLSCVVRFVDGGYLNCVPLKFLLTATSHFELKLLLIEAAICTEGHLNRNMVKKCSF